MRALAASFALLLAAPAWADCIDRCAEQMNDCMAGCSKSGQKCMERCGEKHAKCVQPCATAMAEKSHVSGKVCTTPEGKPTKCPQSPGANPAAGESKAREYAKPLK